MSPFGAETGGCPNKHGFLLWGSSREANRNHSYLLRNKARTLPCQPLVKNFKLSTRENFNVAIFQISRRAINKACFQWCLAECRGARLTSSALQQLFQLRWGFSDRSFINETQTTLAANPCAYHGLSLAALEEILSRPQARFTCSLFLQSPLTQSVLNSEHSHHSAGSHSRDNLHSHLGLCIGREYSRQRRATFIPRPENELWDS